MVKDLTGKKPRTEKQTFAAVASLGIDTVETVLLYHVVPGTRINYRQALKADGVRLTMASGGIVRVDVRKGKRVKLLDADRNDANPRIVQKEHQQGQPADRARNQPGAATGEPLSPGAPSGFE